MDYIKLDKLIKIGFVLRYIEDYSKGYYGTWVKGERGTRVGLLDSLRGIKGIIDELGICSKTSNEIREYVEKIEREYKPDSDLSSQDRAFLKEMVYVWYDRVINESEVLNVVLLNHKYSLNPELLITGAEKFFNVDIWKKLTNSTKRDLDEATRCILFEIPTPAGILALRATESVLRRYYEKKTNQVLTGFINWDTIIKELRNTSADKTLLGHLDYLRNNLRNKLNHPDAILAQKEAENIFPMIITSIEAMIKDF